MATVTHYIHSYYDPEDREKLEKETGQLTEEDPELAWAREASRVARRQAPAPHFVPATVTYGGWDTGQASSSRPSEPASSTSSLGDSLSGWYRSLTYSNTGKSALSPSPSPHVTTDAKAGVRESSSSTSSAPSSAPSKRKKVESRNKNNWFIMNAMQSEPSPVSTLDTSTLPDMLARHPPPLPSEGKFTPPVFLEIGPSNKGFGMLQRSGWNEGEPLGPGVIRRKRADEFPADGDMIPIGLNKGKGKLRQQQTMISPPTCSRTRQETVEVKMENFDDVSELRSVDVIDLTLSDDAGSDSDSGESKQGESGAEATPEHRQHDREHEHDEHVTPDPVEGAASDTRMTLDHDSPYARKALVTPIATVLKSDRLGIGLKAKTVGLYKASQKRVTHNTAALAAHVRAAEESRRRKQAFGRGHKGFERQRKRDEEKRKALLAELKSPW